VRRIVAFAAGQAGVLAFEYVSRFLVIEGFDVPLNQRKVLAIVLGVAACAFLAGASGNFVGGVQALMGGKPRRDLTVTV
jgi:predicted lysophospholipase L1 biosynthesis ABC-type transport system permease subunit